MNYKKGTEVLPAYLLKEVQKYIEGTLVYIPKNSQRVGWGSSNGSRSVLEERNKKILELFKGGLTISEIAEIYYLGEESIKKIVYGKKSL